MKFASPIATALAVFILNSVFSRVASSTGVLQDTLRLSLLGGRRRAGISASPGALTVDQVPDPAPDLAVRLREQLHHSQFEGRQPLLSRRSARVPHLDEAETLETAMNPMRVVAASPVSFAEDTAGVSDVQPVPIATEAPALAWQSPQPATEDPDRKSPGVGAITTDPIVSVQPAASTAEPLRTTTLAPTATPQVEQTIRAATDAVSAGIPPAIPSVNPVTSASTRKRPNTPELAGAGAAQQAPSRTQSGTMTEPLPNDTISEEYWVKVNAAIAEAGKNTRPPSSWNDPPPSPTAEPWKKVFQASEDVAVLDSPQDKAALNNIDLGTPLPVPTDAEVTGERHQISRSISVVPYDVQIGARIMYGLSEKVPVTPPPTQAIVDEMFTAQCPILMFADRLSVVGPRCGSSVGTWAIPGNDRPILRWKDNGKGGLYFGVDSAITGNGSVAFGDFTERFSINRYIFDLYNCLQVKRFSVEESIIRVNNMATRVAYSARINGEDAGTHEAIFYEYTIRHPNGTAVAKTTLFKIDQDKVNISLFDEAEGIAGSVVAIASRTGHWKRESWRQCTGNPRGWDLEFPDSASFDTAATMQDLRVAAAAVINIMAYRDEGIGSDGFQHVGQGALYWNFVSVFFGFFRVLLVVLVIAVVSVRLRIDKKLRKFCFRLEQVLLPKSPVKVRQPVLNPTY